MFDINYGTNRNVLPIDLIGFRNEQGLGERGLLLSQSRKVNVGRKAFMIS